MISVNELTAHLEGTFEGRVKVAERMFLYDPSEVNQVRLDEARRAYDTVYGILYQFDESNSQGDYTL